MLKQLNSPFIPKLLGSFSTACHRCVVFEPYGYAGDLKHIQAQQPNGLFEISTFRHILAEVTLAIMHVHERGYTQRDVKPTGVFMAADGHGRSGQVRVG